MSLLVANNSITTEKAPEPLGGPQCVHCGLCMPACPTYLLTGREEESPRGRIRLMQAINDRQIAPTDAVLKHLDSCLDCRACEGACPSGVHYHELLESTRAKLALGGKAPLDRIDPRSKWFILNILVRPRLLKLFLLPARLLQKSRLYESARKLRIFELLPPEIQQMEKLLPDHGALWPRAIPERISAGGVGAMLAALYKTAVLGRTAIGRGQGPRRTRIGMLTGCVGSVLGNEINRKTADILAASGIDIYAPRAQSCCGAIHHHNGERETARKMARKNIDLFLPLGGKSVDFIVANISGCGAELREYHKLLADDNRYAARADEFSRRVRDINEILLDVELPLINHRIDCVAAYHDACHLAHAQKITEQPRKLMERIPGLKVVPLHESDLCCGAAGTYNLTQPEMAAGLAERKLANIEETEADICIASNIGCSLHLQAAAKRRGKPIRVVHPIELLHQAIFG